jgi:hypothetical protein
MEVLSKGAFLKAIQKLHVRIQEEHENYADKAAKRKKDRDAYIQKLYDSQISNDMDG